MANRQIMIYVDVLPGGQAYDASGAQLVQIPSVELEKQRFRGYVLPQSGKGKVQ